MNGRERWQALLAGERPDRLPLLGISGWREAVERWLGEGLQNESLDGRDVSAALDLVDPEGPLTLPLDLNMVPRFPIAILQMGPDYVHLVDEFGVTKKMHRIDFDRSGGYKQSAGDMSSMSEWLDFPVKDINTWKAIYEERFRPDLSGRLPVDWDETRTDFARKARTRWVVGSPAFPLFGLFGPMRELMGLPGLLYSMVDDPALVHTMVADLTDFWLAAFDRALVGGVRLDQVTFFEDMCSTKAPIIGPAMFREFLSPGYRKVIGGLKDLGVRLFCIDSDGNAWDVLPAMIESGVNGFHPCEVQADMDAGRLRDAFPKLYLNGGIAKRALTMGEWDIEREMDRRFRVAWEKGRYTPQLDHGAPPDIPWANLLVYAEYYRDWAHSPAGPASN